MRVAPWVVQMVASMVDYLAAQKADHSAVPKVVWWADLKVAHSVAIEG